MKKFIFFFRGGLPKKGEEQQNMQSWMEWTKKLSAEGKLESGLPIFGEGKIVQGAKKSVSDIAMSPETVNGFMVVKADDMNGAQKIADDCPALAYDGIVEIWPAMEMPQM